MAVHQCAADEGTIHICTYTDVWYHDSSSLDKVDFSV
jgi:hypothetical protein